MLAPETQTHWGSFANFRAERSAYFESVGGRYTVNTWPTDIAPITDWLSATDPASIDLRHAVLVEVTYPLIARDNAWSLYIVSPGPNGLMVYDVR